MLTSRVNISIVLGFLMKRCVEVLPYQFCPSMCRSERQEPTCLAMTLIATSDPVLFCTPLCTVAKLPFPICPNTSYASLSPPPSEPPNSHGGERLAAPVEEQWNVYRKS